MPRALCSLDFTVANGQFAMVAISFNERPSWYFRIKTSLYTTGIWFNFSASSCLKLCLSIVFKLLTGFAFCTFDSSSKEMFLPLFLNEFLHKFAATVNTHVLKFLLRSNFPVLHKIVKKVRRKMLKKLK